MAADAGSASPGSASRSQPGVLGPVLAEQVLAGLARLQAAGLRRTQARSDVLTVLITAGADLTAPQVHARLRDADRPFDYDYSTVLHALQTLTEQGWPTSSPPAASLRTASPTAPTTTPSAFPVRRSLNLMPTSSRRTRSPSGRRARRGAYRCPSRCARPRAFAAGRST